MKIINLSKKYNSKKILDNISFNFEKGKCYVIVGNNGCGKSTLVKVILGFSSITSGNIINNYSFGYVPERIIMPLNINVYDFLLYVWNIKKGNINDLDYYINYFKLDIYKNKKLKELSKGNLQKVLIITSLVKYNELLIFDEVLNGLDDDIQNKLLYLIKELKNERIIIIVTHYPKIFSSVCDEELKIENGKINKISLSLYN